MHYGSGREVLLYDTDEKVCGTWAYLIGATEDDIMSLPLYDGTWETVQDLDVPQGAKWLIGWWLNKGASRPCNRPSAWMRSGKYPTCFWGPNIRARVASQVASIKAWRVTCSSYGSAPDTHGTWFIDPPYSSTAGRSYKKNSIDYAHLSAWSTSRQGRTIVCESSAATWLPFTYFARPHNTHGPQKHGRRTHEAVWYRP